MGALVLPPPPAPQVTSISLIYPSNRTFRWKQAEGLLRFHKTYLPGLKFYNPGIKINIEHTDKERPESVIAITLEGTDADALRAVSKQVAWRRHFPYSRKGGEEKEVVPTTGDTPESTPPTPASIEPDSDEIVQKSQPSANPSSPSTVNPPTPIYQVTVKRKAIFRSATEIWHLLRPIGGTRPKISAEDKELRESIRAHDTQAEIDRQRVKVVTAQLKQEEAALAKAKKAMEEMSAGIS